MKTPPSQTLINSTSYPTEFQQIILEKSQNFIGREFIFTAITEFLHRHKRGYFTIVGVPGSGKSGIVAKYVTENYHVIYYNAQIVGKSRAEEFLRNICTQLIHHYPDVGAQYSSSSTDVDVLPDNATQGSWFLSLLLQKISDRLEPPQRLIIAIDALDAIDPNSQPPGTNLFYLPRYLPDRVYFLLTRRPFKREKSGLLIEAPSQILDLSEYPEENREDVQAYIQANHYLFPNKETSSPLTEEELENRSKFVSRLTTASENNFMYLHHTLNAIAEDFDSQPYQFDCIPPGLEAYYQQHWQKMKSEGLSDLVLKVLSVLTCAETGEISAKGISQAIAEDEYDVEEILENWLEFLQQHRIGKETRYSFYHSHFRLWLAKQISKTNGEC
ncbi:ATP-binding protein [Brasilonema octagenarum UFV-E1]|uniref:ATP-binding protein n=1 Tax=Brasilonema sennae CENA114 TaxID=415709 RepID=A0A856M9F8_9CYAN|nr:ATP-binding protein [Brasilonema sennae]QDL07825.1 ATP-binding protein [Brasilonema sennae CENA114]QDL14185.1 ATP-binding protein [Brasilonema octagenarum UFV-E1]